MVCCLKSGGMGAIYECIDRNTERHRALKAMLPEIVADAGLRARFKLEATITADVDSEHIVDVFDAGVDEQTGIPFLVMELLKGEDLGALLRRSKRLAPAEVVLLLHQASRALDQTHAVFIVHRDLKPENLFLTHRSDGSPHLKLLDFGIAKIIAQSGAAKTTAVVGTPLYMSPEQASGAGTIGPAADIYALGHITFTLLAGEAFWEQDARRSPSLVAFMLKVVEGSAESARERACALGAELPSGFDAWFAKATAPSPQNRFVTASELVLALADVLGVPLPRETSRPQLAGLASGSEAEQPGQRCPESSQQVHRRGCPSRLQWSRRTPCSVVGRRRTPL